MLVLPTDGCQTLQKLLYERFFIVVWEHQPKHRMPWTLCLKRNDGSILSMATFHGCRVGLVDCGVPNSLCILASHVRIDCPIGFLRFLEQRAMESMQHEECSVGQHHRHHQLYRYGMYPRVMLCRVVLFRPTERWHVSKMTAAPNRRSARIPKSIPSHFTSHHITS